MCEHHQLDACINNTDKPANQVTNPLVYLDNDSTKLDISSPHPSNDIESVEEQLHDDVGRF